MVSDRPVGDNDAGRGMVGLVAINVLSTTDPTELTFGQINYLKRSFRK